MRVALKGFKQQNVKVRSAFGEDHLQNIWRKGWQRILLEETRGRVSQKSKKEVLRTPH